MTVGVWPERRVARAAALWAEGKKTPEIMEILGCEKGQLMGVMIRHREMFPQRVLRRLRTAVKGVSEERPLPVPKVYHDRVKRTTAWGETVTLPRVTFIDGPYQAAAE